MGEFNCAPYLFRPAWVLGETLSKIGYVIELSYPCSVVVIPETGVFEVPNKRLHFLHRETHWRYVGFVYKELGLEYTNCFCVTRVKEVTP